MYPVLLYRSGSLEEQFQQIGKLASKVETSKMIELLGSAETSKIQEKYKK